MNIFSGIFPGVTTDGGGDSGGKMARADQETGKRVVVFFKYFLNLRVDIFLHMQVNFPSDSYGAPAAPVVGAPSGPSGPVAPISDGYGAPVAPVLSGNAQGPVAPSRPSRPSRPSYKPNGGGGGGFNFPKPSLPSLPSFSLPKLPKPDLGGLLGKFKKPSFQLPNLGGKLPNLGGGRPSYKPNGGGGGFGFPKPSLPSLPKPDLSGITNIFGGILEAKKVTVMRSL